MIQKTMLQKLKEMNWRRVTRVFRILSLVFGILFLAAGLVICGLILFKGLLAELPPPIIMAEELPKDTRLFSRQSEDVFSVKAEWGAKEVLTESVKDILEQAENSNVTLHITSSRNYVRYFFFSKNGISYASRLARWPGAPWSLPGMVRIEEMRIADKRLVVVPGNDGFLFFSSLLVVVLVFGACGGMFLKIAFVDVKQRQSDALPA